MLDGNRSCEQAVSQCLLRFHHINILMPVRLDLAFKKPAEVAGSKWMPGVNELDSNPLSKICRVSNFVAQVWLLPTKFEIAQETIS